ncbi:MAG: hypothetical protein ACK4ST_17460, partial [Elioraea tepidiphila]
VAEDDMRVVADAESADHASEILGRRHHVRQMGGAIGDLVDVEPRTTAEPTAQDVEPERLRDGLLAARERGRRRGGNGLRR